MRNGQGLSDFGRSRLEDESWDVNVCYDWKFADPTERSNVGVLCVEEEQSERVGCYVVQISEGEMGQG